MPKLFRNLSVIAVLLLSVIVAPMKANAYYNIAYNTAISLNQNGPTVNVTYYVDYGSNLYGTTNYPSRINTAFDDWKKVFAGEGITLNVSQTSNPSSANLTFYIRNLGYSHYYGATTLYLVNDRIVNDYTMLPGYTHTLDDQTWLNRDWDTAQITYNDYYMHHYCDAGKTVAMISMELGHFFGFKTMSISGTHIMDIGDRNVFSGKTYNTLYEQGFYFDLKYNLNDMYWDWQ